MFHTKGQYDLQETEKRNGTFNVFEDNKPRNESDFTDVPEEKSEKKTRIRSIYIICIAMLINALGFSIILSSVWPYLRQLYPPAEKQFLGWVVAANPMGQFIFSPIMGWWGNHLGSVRIPCIVCGLLYFVGSACYSLLALFPYNQRMYWMVVSRFIVGASSACIAPCRSYVSAATTLKERMTFISAISLFQTIGFILGPALQASLTPLGVGDRDENGYYVLSWDMFTSCSWISAASGLLTVVLFLPGVFKEKYIAENEFMLRHSKDMKTDKNPDRHKVDRLAAWLCIVIYFVFVLAFVLLETIGTPLVMDQFGWTEANAIKWVGITMSVGAVVSGVSFIGSSLLTKRFDERKVLLIAGIIPMIISQLFFLPIFSTDLPPMQEIQTTDGPLSTTQLLQNETHKNVSFSGISLISTVPPPPTDNVHQLGCPTTQKWCLTTPALTIWQAVVEYAISAAAYPVCIALTQSIFSKILGPKPQGTWMGILTGSASLSRMLGPIFVAYIYTNFGILWTAVTLIVSMTLSLIAVLACYKRVVPMR